MKSQHATCMRAGSLQSCPTLCDPMDLARQAPLSMGFSRQEYWSGLPCHPPGDLPDPRIESGSLVSPALAGGFFTPSATWEAPEIPNSGFQYQWFLLFPARDTSPMGRSLLVGRGSSFPFSSVQSLSHVRLCNPMDCSTPGFPVHHQLPEFTQTHVHRVGDAIQTSDPLSSPSPPALKLSQPQGLFQ